MRPSCWRRAKLVTPEPRHPLDLASRVPDWPVFDCDHRWEQQVQALAGGLSAPAVLPYHPCW